MCASSKEKACLSLAQRVACLPGKRAVQLCNMRRNNSSAGRSERLQFHEDLEVVLFRGRSVTSSVGCSISHPTCWWSRTRERRPAPDLAGCSGCVLVVLSVGCMQIAGLALYGCAEECNGTEWWRAQMVSFNSSCDLLHI